MAPNITTTIKTTRELLHELTQERKRSAQLQRDVENLGASLAETERVLHRANGHIGRLEETRDKYVEEFGKRSDDLTDAFDRLAYSEEQLQKAEAAHRELLRAHIELKEALKARNIGPPKAKIRLCLHAPAKKKISA